MYALYIYVSLYFVRLEPSIKFNKKNYIYRYLSNNCKYIDKSYENSSSFFLKYAIFLMNLVAGAFRIFNVLLYFVRLEPSIKFNKKIYIYRYLSNNCKYIDKSYENSSSFF